MFDAAIWSMIGEGALQTIYMTLVSTLIAYIILAVMQGIVSTKVHKQVSGNDNAEVYDTKFVYSLAVLTIVICTACVILYQYTILRYSIFGLIVILAIVNRKRIASIFQKKHTPNG